MNIAAAVVIVLAMGILVHIHERGEVMMKKIRVIILEGNGWYDGCVGNEFDVYEWGNSYVLAEDYDAGHNRWWRHIDKADCEVVV